MLPSAITSISRTRPNIFLKIHSSVSGLLLDDKPIRYTHRYFSAPINNFPENSWNVKSKIATFIKGRGDTETQNATLHPDLATTLAWNNANWWESEIYQRRIFIDLESEKSYYGAGTIKDYKGLQKLHPYFIGVFELDLARFS